ncbi:ABC transporter ATP-binding protein (plasmid) [Deinococcus sp. KNUC1210]|uniref:ABC transporter ATP-binding protein n=1 Tax=Deinococcus sp. KNUC1210 TaxID=2917691 RepID=UPI001EF14267|nr:ABC transporter ATP-binding protein [Deinococcus sp. KNUC1210]ULH17134.1 ABC transporter ATP-binding protein [Deinococcus sp. KNUC1210]
MSLSSPSRTPTDPASSGNTLEIEGLRKVFTARGRANVVAVNDVTFSIRRGEVLGLVGESGSGKSTIARLIAHLYEPTSGQIRLSGQNIPNRMGGGALRQFRKHVQMIFQDPYASLNPLHPVGYTLSRPLKIHRLARGNSDKQVHALLERVGLSPAATYAAKRPFELSGGQRQRVGIARALAAQPELILADEPTSALDVSIRLDVMNLLLDLKDQEGLSMLFITHDLAGARYMSDRVAVLYAGTLVELGPAEQVIDRPQHPYTQLLKSAAPKPDAGLTPDHVEARGEVPDLKALPPGCPFEPRCPYAMPECKDGLPRMYDVGEGHQARCILHDPAVKAKRGGSVGEYAL